LICVVGKENNHPDHLKKRQKVYKLEDYLRALKPKKQLMWIGYSVSVYINTL
jgi:hypothetical protein